MLASGNFLEPYYNGIKHFHKPPAPPYWFNALGMQIFGVNGFGGVRFFGSVAAILTLYVTRKIAYLLSNDDEIADTSVIVLSASVLFLIVSRVVSTDIYLALLTVLTLYHMFKQIYSDKSMMNAVLIGVYLGLGFMTKGPTIFVFTLIPFLIISIFDRQHKKKFLFYSVFSMYFSFSGCGTPMVCLRRECQ